MSDWYNLKDNYKDYYGFIYIITNLKTGQYYIGKKFFWKQIIRKPLKGKIRRRRCLIESDWKEYYGSSKELLTDIETQGNQNFKREIIKYCKDKWECSYFEMVEQVKRKVLFDEFSYNGIINVRLGKKKGKD